MHAHSKKTQTCSKSLALFDFDGTLCKVDSFTAFFKNVLPKKHFYWHCLPLLPQIIGYYLKLYPADQLRPKLSQKLLKNVELSFIEQQNPAFTTKIIQALNPEVYQRLLWHKQQQHDIYIVSAGLNLYLKSISQVLNIPLICSEIEISPILNGKYITPDCSKYEKVNRIKQQIILKNYDYIYAYGNSFEDYDMLQLADHAYWVKSDNICLLF